VADPGGLARWLADQDDRERVEPFTYVVDVRGDLRLAPRRSEDVACARGGDVLAAGEIQFERDDTGDWVVVQISNQSTGYCPDVTSWSVVQAALDRAGVRHPGGFTHPVVFRRCPDCGAVNVVRDGDFVCAICDADLPARWNVDEP
jgi:hypothetical protein